MSRMNHDGDPVKFDVIAVAATGELCILVGHDLPSNAALSRAAGFNSAPCRELTAVVCGTSFLTQRVLGGDTRAAQLLVGHVLDANSPESPSLTGQADEVTMDKTDKETTSNKAAYASQAARGVSYGWHGSALAQTATAIGFTGQSTARLAKKQPTSSPHSCKSYSDPAKRWQATIQSQPIWNRGFPTTSR